MVYYSQHQEGNKAFHGYGEVRAERNGFEEECVTYEINNLEYFFYIYKQKDENNNIQVFFEVPNNFYTLCNQEPECQCLQILRDVYNFAQRYVSEKLVIDDSKHKCGNA